MCLVGVCVCVCVRARARVWPNGLSAVRILKVTKKNPVTWKSTVLAWFYTQQYFCADLNGRAVLGEGLRPLAFWNCLFESRRGHECLSFSIVVCCQVEVSAMSRSLVQRSPTDCGVSLCLSPRCAVAPETSSIPVCRDCSVGIATRYGLDGQGF